MANFIYGGDCCCSIGNKDNEVLRIYKEIIFVRQDTGEEVDFSLFGNPKNLPDGITLVTKEKWQLKKNFETIAKFDTESEAQAELKRIVDELAKSNLVVEVKK